METTKKMKSLEDKVKEVMTLMEDVMDCVSELNDNNYSERRDSIRMRGKYGMPSYRHDDMDDYDEPHRYRRY